VQGPSEELLLTRILRAGDTYRVPDRGDITLMTGNAGGLEVIVDGENLGVLGKAGAVRRDIPLEPDRLRQQAQR
jgi:cytoskeleton protein RodZ